MKRLSDIYAPYVLLLLLFATALIFRPILPIDETRYLTVAWEMFLHKQYAVLTLNFEPYHHKPPMLFWLINIAWEIFGVSRMAAFIPIFSAAASVIFLTQKLADRLFPQEQVGILLPWLVLGSVPYLIYSTMIMFDVLVSALLLATLVLFLDYARNPKLYRVLIAGIVMGLGVLTKGPVMYLYVLCPLLLYPYWKQEHNCSKGTFYKGILGTVLISFAPVLLWLIPALSQTNNDFAFWLLWNQTAGRISGNFGAAHVRPFYFYLTLLPLLFLPWVFLPKLWKNLRVVNFDPALKFLVAATLPAFFIFSLISGKQPHYLLPLLPFVFTGIGFLIQHTSIKHIKIITIFMVFICIAGQIAAFPILFSKYDLTPYAKIYQDHKNADWSFSGKYQGELGFVAKLEKPIMVIKINQVSNWFTSHPGGLAIINYNDDSRVSKFKEIYSHKYRGRKLGIFMKEDGSHD